MQTVTSSNLALRFGKSRKLVTINSLRDGVAKWEKFRDRHCLGASESPKLTVVELATGQPVAAISYNGRVWNMAGKEIECES